MRLFYKCVMCTQDVLVAIVIDVQERGEQNCTHPVLWGGGGFTLIKICDILKLISEF